MSSLWTASQASEGMHFNETLGEAHSLTAASSEAHTEISEMNIVGVGGLHGGGVMKGGIRRGGEE